MVGIIRIVIFFLIIISVKVVSFFILQEKDIKLKKMREAVDFIEFLRVYSCSMKMPIVEIVEKYKFKFVDVKKIYLSIISMLNIKSGKYNDCKFKRLICNDEVLFPMDFLDIIFKILDFYGITFTEDLNKNMELLYKELQEYMYEYEKEYKERKKLINKLSLLMGSFFAILVI